MKVLHNNWWNQHLKIHSPFIKACSSSFLSLFWISRALFAKFWNAKLSKKLIFDETNKNNSHTKPPHILFFSLIFIKFMFFSCRNLWKFSFATTLLCMYDDDEEGEQLPSLHNTSYIISTLHIQHPLNTYTHSHLSSHINHESLGFFPSFFSIWGIFCPFKGEVFFWRWWWMLCYARNTKVQSKCFLVLKG